MPHRPARVRAAVALLATAALTTTMMAAYAAPTAGAAGATGATVARGDASGGKAAAASRAEKRAMSAVTTARAIAEGRQKGDLTMALREVANTRTSLTGADRAAAEAILKRPTATGGDGTLSYTVPEATPVCSADICVHYVSTSVDAVNPADANSSGVPDYVELTLAVLTGVHNDYIAAGYREPKPDGNLGGAGGKIDVYLGELGPDGLYGYCTSDQPEPDPTPNSYDRWAYCALDNDYSSDEFPTNTPVENLQVTVAHEYFHATQYAYDRYEDSWLLEATAAWVEDEMFDAVDDNLQYLASSQLRRPDTSLDTFGNNGFHYGTWSFFRFLTEKYRTRKGKLPRLVLDIFLKADGAKGKPDQYSWQAINTVLKKKRTTGAAMLGAYAVANRRPAQRYSEGKANHYPVAPLAGSLKITARKGARANIRLNHLTTATGRLTPKSLTAGNWKLKLTFDLAPKVRGSSVLITSAAKAGKVRTSKVRLNRQGDAVKRIPFSSSKIAWVEVTLVNGSGRFKCFTQGAYSCQGKALDQKVPMKFTAFAVR